MNCLIFRQDAQEWLNYGSSPNKLSSIEMKSKSGSKAMKRMSGIIVGGYVRECKKASSIPIGIEGLIAKYWAPPVLMFKIKFYYNADFGTGYPRTPATTDEEAPEWPIDVDE